MTHRASDQNPESSSLPSSLSREETASAAEQEYQAFYNKSGVTGFSLTALAPQTLDHIARDIFMAAWEASETRHREVVALPPHRVCIAQEHDPANGKMHGCCVICAESWPCSTERTRPTREVVEAAERLAQVAQVAAELPYLTTDDLPAWISREGYRRLNEQNKALDRIALTVEQFRAALASYQQKEKGK